MKLVTGDCEVENIKGAVIYLQIVNAAIQIHPVINELVREHSSTQVAFEIGSLAVAANYVTRELR